MFFITTVSLYRWHTAVANKSGSNFRERFLKLVYNDKFDIVRIFLMKLLQSQYITELCRLLQSKCLQPEISSAIFVRETESNIRQAI